MKDGRGEDFIRDTRAMIEQVHTQEPGNLLYCLAQAQSDSSLFLFAELYTNGDAIMSHGKTAYYHQGQRTMKPLLEKVVDVTVLETVPSPVPVVAFDPATASSSSSSKRRKSKL